MSAAPRCLPRPDAVAESNYPDDKRGASYIGVLGVLGRKILRLELCCRCSVSFRVFTDPCSEGHGFHGDYLCLTVFASWTGTAPTKEAFGCGVAREVTFNCLSADQIAE